MTQVNGILPFLSESGKNIRRHRGYLFKDGYATLVSSLYPKLEDWLKVKAYITILEGNQKMYTGIPTIDRDAEIKAMLKLLNNKTFNTWVNNNPIKPTEKQK